MMGFWFIDAVTVERWELDWKRRLSMCRLWVVRQRITFSSKTFG